MNFALILFLATLFTGAIALADRLVFAKRRAPDAPELDVGIETGVVDKKGAWLQFNGELIGQGKDAARQTLVDKPDLAQKIISSIMAKRKAPGAASA